jgi:hypothetical protein
VDEALEFVCAFKPPVIARHAWRAVAIQSRRSGGIQLDVKLSAFGLGSFVIPQGALLTSRVAMTV